MGGGSLFAIVKRVLYLFMYFCKQGMIFLLFVKDWSEYLECCYCFQACYRWPKQGKTG